MEAKKQLVKDLVFIGVAWVLSVIFIANACGEFDFTMIFAGLPFIGIPFGWRWSGKVFTAVSLVGIVIKLCMAIMLGMVALPVTLIKDIAGIVQTA